MVLHAKCVASSGDTNEVGKNGLCLEWPRGAGQSVKSVSTRLRGPHVSLTLDPTYSLCNNMLLGNFPCLLAPFVIVMPLSCIAPPLFESLEEMLMFPLSCGCGFLFFSPSPVFSPLSFSASLFYLFLCLSHIAAPLFVSLDAASFCLCSPFPVDERFSYFLASTAAFLFLT